MSEVDIPKVAALRGTEAQHVLPHASSSSSNQQQKVIKTTGTNEPKERKKMRKQQQKEVAVAAAPAVAVAERVGGEGTSGSGPGVVEDEAMFSTFPLGSIGDGEFDFRPFFLIRKRTELYDRIAARCEEMVSIKVGFAITPLGGGRHCSPLGGGRRCCR